MKVKQRISARVIADSVNPDGDRLITVEGTFNRYLLAELNTHRRFSRNSASSRAIPVKKTIRQVWADPALPISWGTNQAGMQARSELSGWRRWCAIRLFLLARIPAIIIVWLLTLVKLHKQVANRLLEPWVWHTAIMSATEWDNFFKLRLHPDAQPEFQELARCTRVAIDGSTPRKVEWGGWHLPYTDEHDEVRPTMVPLDYDDSVPVRAWISCARCAAVSYVRQGEKRDPAKDIDLMLRLKNSGHWSPFEHPAQAMPRAYLAAGSSNFDGWKQLRKFYPSESGRIERVERHDIESCPNGSFYGCDKCT